MRFAVTAVLLIRLVGARGLEPRLADSKSAFLPLKDIPTENEPPTITGLCLIPRRTKLVPSRGVEPRLLVFQTRVLPSHSQGMEEEVRIERHASRRPPGSNRIAHH